MIYKTDSKILCYSLAIPDDADTPTMYWSAVQSSAELDLFHRLLTDRDVSLYLYNETMTNVASGKATADLSTNAFLAIQGATFLRGDVNTYANEAQEKMEAAFSLGSKIRLHIHDAWHKITSNYITDALTVCTVDLFGGEEGSQQEIVSRWLADGIHPPVAHLNPEVHEPTGPKEFTDLLFSYEEASFVLMSKTLSLITRTNFGRQKMKNDTLKKLQTDCRKLKYQCRKIHEGTAIYERRSDQEIAFCRSRIHAIALIADLSFLHGEASFGRQRIAEFFKPNEDYLHVLDTTQMFRLVQAAQMLAKGSNESEAKHFERLLLRRFEFAAEHDTFDFDMSAHLTANPPYIRFSL